MFGKFVGGLDIEVLWSHIYDEIVNDPILDDVITAQSVNLQDDIDTNALPRLNAGMRDINAVMSSSFVFGKSLIMAQKTKAMAEFSATVKLEATNRATQRWAKHLEWNHGVIEQHMKLTQLYWATKFDWVNADEETATREVLWPFTVLDHQRAIVGTLNGAPASAIKGETKFQRALGQVLSGASAANYLLGGSGGGKAGGVSSGSGGGGLMNMLGVGSLFGGGSGGYAAFGAGEAASLQGSADLMAAEIMV